MKNEENKDICKILHGHAERLYSGGVMDEASLRIMRENCSHRPDEDANITFVDHIRIIDKDTNEELLNKRG